MPFLKTIKAQINRKYSLQFCTPTQDIYTAQTAIKYIGQQAAYSLIPGVQNSALLNTQHLLLQILPYTKNCIVDITMPYVETTKKKNIIRHVARYILCDRQLLGIRIKPSEAWPRTKTLKQEISTNLENFYNQQGIINYKRQILVGEFLIVTQHFKLAPLFTSQLTSLFDSTTINLLNDYYNLGCQIFSIVNDLTQEKKKNFKDPFEILRNYRRQNTIVLHCGMHLNIDLTDIYKTKSYAIQTSDRLKKIHVSKLDRVYIEQFIADLNQTKKGSKFNPYDDSKIISSDIQTLNCSHLRIKLCFQKIQFNALGKFQESMDIEEEKNIEKYKENQLTLYLWNLYLNVNKKTPFILPCSMNDKDQILMKKIFKLSQITNIQKNKLIKFLKLDSKSKILKKYEAYNFDVISLEKIITKPQGYLIPIYFSLKERIYASNIEIDETTLPNLQKKIINCLRCLPQDIFKNQENQFGNDQNQVKTQDQKFVEKFLKRKNGTTLQLFYFQMAKYYSQNRLNPKFIADMYECLRLKIIQQFNGNPFQVYIHTTPFENIQNIFDQAAKKYFIKGINIKDQDDQNQGEQNQTSQNNFRAFIKKVNYHCLNQKKSYHPCHICGSLFNKKEKSNFGRLCLGCSCFVCYGCYDKKTGEIAQSEQSFQQCLICQNKCDCDKCVKKRTKNQGNNDAPAKLSFFRSENNILSSAENIRMNEQENIPNEMKNQNRYFGKSQLLGKGSLNKIYSSTQQSGAQPEQISIVPCWTCELQNRVDRIIKFQCSVCMSIKCLSCQKSQNSNRSWVLRGNITCNGCLQKQDAQSSRQIQIKQLKVKIGALQHELNNTKRQRFIPNTTLQSSMNFGECAIIQQSHQNESQSNQQQRPQKGSTTPIFDRSVNGNKGKQSPVNFGGPIQNYSVNDSNKKQIGKRKNSSDSNGSSRSVQSKKSEPTKKETKKQQRPKRKNSSGSSKKSQVSFKNKPKSNSNSSGGSVKQDKNKKPYKRSQAESGQFQQSSSSQQKQKQPKKQWKKNYHQNTDKPEGEFGRGGYRGRGKGSYDNRQHQANDREDNNRKWDNNRRGDYKNKFNDRQGGQSWQGGQRDRFKNDNDGQGGQRDRFKNDNNDDRFGDRFGDRGSKSRNFNNSSNNSYDNNNSSRDNYENNRYDKKNDYKDRQEDKSRNEDKKDGYLLVNVQNKSSGNEQNFDY